MDRRRMLQNTGLITAAALGGAASSQAADMKQFFELRSYEIESEDQKRAIAEFAGAAAIPALNRIGIEPVGVFEPEEGLGPVYILLPHRSILSFATMGEKLMQDDSLYEKGADFLNAPAASPMYSRIESSLFEAFDGMPKLERPVESEGRIFQLRIYESPSVLTGLKKIEMFNRGEIEIFRKTGLHPVFFGQAIAGPKMPNLTYMLSFKSMEEQKANWKTFVNHPDWQELKSIPEYADKKILSNITNIQLKPMACSQI